VGLGLSTTNMLQPKSFHFPWRITLKKGVDWGPFHPTRIRFLPQKTSASKKWDTPSPKQKSIFGYVWYFWLEQHMINHEIPTISDPFGSASSRKPTGFSFGE
jgi:hypothetical protein